MEIQVGISKIKKYAVSESGDTLEVIERPGGGLSVVLVDGQRSGRGAKRISNKVAGKVVSYLGEGIRDGAAARAASDFLFHERSGKVMATLNILSIDLVSKTVVITRNNPAPVLIAQAGQVHGLDKPSSPVGLRLGTRPVINEIPLEIGLCVLIFSDGITNAGERTAESMDVMGLFQHLIEMEAIAAQEIADKLLDKALTLDQGRPVDDISVAVMKVSEKTQDPVRRMSIRLPLLP